MQANQYFLWSLDQDVERGLELPSFFFYILELLGDIASLVACFIMLVSVFLQQFHISSFYCILLYISLCFDKVLFIYLFIFFFCLTDP